MANLIVCIYGIGYVGWPATAEASLDVINWFKAQGCYVFGSVHRLVAFRKEAHLAAKCSIKLSTSGCQYAFRLGCWQENEFRVCALDGR